MPKTSRLRNESFIGISEGNYSYNTPVTNLGCFWVWTWNSLAHRLPKKNQNGFQQSESFYLAMPELFLNFEHSNIASFQMWRTWWRSAYRPLFTVLKLRFFMLVWEFIVLWNWPGFRLFWTVLPLLWRSSSVIWRYQCREFSTNQFSVFQLLFLLDAIRFLHQIAQSIKYLPMIYQRTKLTHYFWL